MNNAGIVFRRIRGVLRPIKVKHLQAAGELAGLSLLAYPTLKAAFGKKDTMSNKTKARFELGGLVTLGLATAATSFPQISKIALKIGRRLK